jgi:serine/threonine protein kinase
LLAIEEIHSKNIIYRDLKPENIVLDCEGHIKLIDFGLSKEISSSAHNQSFCGTYAYLAPEMILKQGHSKPVDWYSFGTLLFQLLTGQIPFWNNNREQMFNNIINSQLTLPATLSQNAQSLIT